MQHLSKSITTYFRQGTGVKSYLSSYLGESRRQFSSLGLFFGSKKYQNQSRLLDVSNINLENKQYTSNGSYEMNDNGYSVKLNLKKFKPENISVKTKSNKVFIQSSLQNANLEPKSESEHITRLFLRVYQIPADGDTKKTTAELTADGMLLVQVPKVTLEPDTSEKIIPIKKLKVSLKAKEYLDSTKLNKPPST